MAQANSIPSPLNPGASEYVPLLLQEEATSPPTEEFLPPIENVPRDVSSIFFVQKEGGQMATLVLTVPLTPHPVEKNSPPQPQPQKPSLPPRLP
jgi:hypothetical protein